MDFIHYTDSTRGEENKNTKLSVILPPNKSMGLRKNNNYEKFCKAHSFLLFFLL